MIVRDEAKRIRDEEEARRIKDKEEAKYLVTQRCRLTNTRTRRPSSNRTWSCSPPGKQEEVNEVNSCFPILSI